MLSSTTVNPTSVNLRVRIPKIYQRQPIISRLISRYNLIVNIAAALLATADRDDGWFDLDIQGSSQQIEAGIAYLKELNVEITEFDFKNAWERTSECTFIVESINPDITNALGGDLTGEKGQTSRTKLQVCVPKNYQQQPVIAELVFRYGLTVNITSAHLDADAQNDGWFDLELWGSRQQIVFGFKYLKQLGLQIWV